MATLQSSLGRLRPPFGKVIIVLLSAVILPVLINLFYHGRAENLGLSPPVSSDPVYFIFAPIAVSLLLTLFTRQKLRFLMLQSLPVFVWSLSIALPEGLWPVIASFAIGITTLNFLDSTQLSSLSVFATVLFLVVFGYLGWHHLDKSFWLDEFCVGASLTKGWNFAAHSLFEEAYLQGRNLPLAETALESIHGTIRYDSHPPLSELLFYMIARAFGFDLVTLRVFAIFVSSLTVTVGFVLLWKTESPVTAILYTTLMLTSPQILRNLGIEIRPYFLYIALTQTSILSFYYFIQKKDEFMLWIWVVSSALNLYTHYFAVVPLIAFFIVIYSAKQTAVATILSKGFWTIAILAFPATQIGLYQRTIKADWLKAPDLHMTHLGLQQILDFFHISFSSWLFLVLALMMLGIITTRLLLKTGNGSVDLAYGSKALANIQFQGALRIAVSTSIVILLLIDFDILKFFIKSLSEQHLPEISPNLTVYLTFLLQVIVLGCFVLLLFRFPPAGFLPLDRFALYPIGLYAGLLAGLMAVTMLGFISLAGKIYSYRNAVILLIPMFLILASFADYLIERVIRLISGKHAIHA